MPTPAALARLPAVMLSALIFVPFAIGTLLGSSTQTLPSFTTSSSLGMLNLLLLSALKALPSTSGGVCRRGSPTSAIQTGIEDLEMGVRGNGRDAPGVLVSEAG